MSSQLEEIIKMFEKQNNKIKNDRDNLYRYIDQMERNIIDNMGQNIKDNISDKLEAKCKYRYINRILDINLDIHLNKSESGKMKSKPRFFIV
jgi:hypothetical protein